MGARLVSAGILILVCSHGGRRTLCSPVVEQTNLLRHAQRHEVCDADEDEDEGRKRQRGRLVFEGSGMWLMTGNG
jgi:hypothetical protein